MIHLESLLVGALFLTGVNASAHIDQDMPSENSAPSEPAMSERGEVRAEANSAPSESEKFNIKACVEEEVERTVEARCSDSADSQEAFASCVSHAKSAARKTCKGQRAESAAPTEVEYQNLP